MYCEHAQDRAYRTMGKIREDEFIDQEFRDYVVDFLSLRENFVAASYSDQEAGRLNSAVSKVIVHGTGGPVA